MNMGASREPNQPQWRLSWMALPLAFVSLPLYVLLPHHYATQWGISLSSLGAVLLAVRGLDALLDPWLGARCDAWFAHGMAQVQGWARRLAVLLSAGFAGLWLPDVWLSLAGLAVTPSHVLQLATLCLLLAYGAATTLNLLLQSWGTRMGGSVTRQSRIVAWREGMGLLGVILACVLPTLCSEAQLVGCFALMLVLGAGLWQLAPQPDAPSPHLDTMQGVGHAASPWRQAAFRALLRVFVLNGVASAVPATLVMFFIQDRLQAPAGFEAYYLGTYFVAATLSLPLWLRLIRQLGLVRAWLCGMVLAMTVFVWTVTLSAGDWWGFGVICMLSGLALGADLVVPGALLTGVIQQAGDSGQHEGRYMGWWQVAIKLNLALAAGLGLPTLQALGYTPGTTDTQGLWALALAYGALPCALKLAAAWWLWRSQFLITGESP